MKREQLQHVSLDDRRRRTLMRLLIQRSGNKPADIIAWYDKLSDDDKILLLVGIQIGFAEMALSVRNLANSATPLFGAMVRDIELRNRGDEIEHADTKE